MNRSSRMFSLPRFAALTVIYIVLCAQQAEAKSAIQEIKTPEGYTIWLSQDHTLPLVTFSFAFERSGAAYDPAGKQGTASFLTQMLDEGAGEMDSLAFRKALENKAIRYSAAAGEDSITVTVQALADHKHEAFRLMLLSLTQPRFDADAMERVRASILADLSQLQENPNYIASRVWKEKLFGTHPYAHPRRGTATSVASITTDDLRQFAQNHFFREHAPVISVAGDITAEEIKNWPLPALSAPQQSEAQAPGVMPAKLPEAIMPENGGNFPVVHDVPQTVVIASLPSIRREDSRFYALQLLSRILGGDSITSRLGAEVRNQRGLAYYIGSSLEVLDRASYLYISFSTRTDSVSEAVDVVKTIVKEIAEKGVTEQELNDAKSYLTGSFPLEHDTQAEWVALMQGIQHFNLGRDFPEKRNALIEAVTLQQVNDLARELLVKPPLTVMVGRFNEQPKPQ